MATVNTSVSDFGLTTDGIFIRAPRLTKDDIGERLSGNDVYLIEEFEDAWKKFLSSRPGTLPPGTKIKNFRNMQTRLNLIEGKKQNVCMELQRQLDFFDSSKEKLEEKYSKEKEEATLQQESVIAGLEKEIDNIAVADKILSEVLPWEHYFDNLESNAASAHGASSASHKTGHSQVIRPSDEALYLANIHPSDAVDAHKSAEAESYLIHAYRIDNALLKAKSVMLKREADRLEKNLLADRALAKLLMDNDVWAAMASSKQ
mmetsp:Transcript_4050/g.9661  ORF Transcript_4050/g.9661 Transcript_4050/m.9661 type:complete len:260 (-) Transcript_4050:152-931(-)